MQRVRRLASIAVIALIGVTVLAGCRSEPGVAAYIGDYQITEDRITAIIDELKDARAEEAGARAEQASEGPRQPDGTPQSDAAPQPADAAPLPSRSTVLTTLVLKRICERLAADRGYQPQNQVTAEQVAPELGVPPESDLARERAGLYTCISGVPSGDPVVPTDEELTEIVRRGRAAGVIPNEVSDFDARQQLDGEQLRGALGSRNMLAEAAAAYDVTVNPRYRPLEFPVLAFQGNIAAVSVPLGEGDPGIVVDAR